MANEYFHFTMMTLAPGSIIQPGNWGRLIRRYQSPFLNAPPQFGNAWIIAREALFEIIRLNEFADKPSRWETAFCCFTAEEAKFYQSKTDRVLANVMHKVELVDPTANSHIGAVELVDFPPPESPFVDQTTTRAHQYWQGNKFGESIMELATLSPLRVLEALP